jgi:hypothetical protein
MRFRTASFRGLAAAAVVLFGTHDFTIAASLPVKVVYENNYRFDVTWTGSFPDGVDNSLDTPELTFWSVGPSPITLTYQGGGDGWKFTITGQHIKNPHPSPEIAPGDLATFNTQFPNASGTRDLDVWQSVFHENIPHWDFYRLTYTYSPGPINEFSAELQGVHVPEIDPATGGSALSLVAGVLAMIEQRRRRAALVA